MQARADYHLAVQQHFQEVRENYSDSDDDSDEFEDARDNSDDEGIMNVTPASRRTPTRSPADEALEQEIRVETGRI